MATESTHSLVSLGQDMIKVAGSERTEGHHRALLQVEALFREMPGLRLTDAQVARLCALDVPTCRAVLARLVATGFLVETGNAKFARASEISAGA